MSWGLNLHLHNVACGSNLLISGPAKGASLRPHGKGQAGRRPPGTEGSFCRATTINKRAILSSAPLCLARMETSVTILIVIRGRSWCRERANHGVWVGVRGSFCVTATIRSSQGCPRRARSRALSFVPLMWTARPSWLTLDATAL